MENEQQEPGAAAPQASDYVAEVTFDEMGLSEPVRRAIAEKGYTKPTPVQARTFKAVREGKDVIVRSKTGTGKTAAFAIPTLERIPDGRRKPSALVMCPTRELAIQVAEEFTSLAKHRDLSVVTIYGGASMGDQLDKLKAGAEIVVGTPGRIYDHIRRGTLKLGEVMVSGVVRYSRMICSMSAGTVAEKSSCWQSSGRPSRMRVTSSKKPMLSISSASSRHETMHSSSTSVLRRMWS